MYDLLHAPLEVLYEHGPCLAVFKPPGLATQAPPGIDSMEVRVKALLRERDPSAERVYLGVPHRLDRAASGAMVFALKRNAARSLAKQFEQRRVRKVYWACVAKRISAAEGRWEDYMGKVADEPRAEIVSADAPQAQLAVLRFRRLQQMSFGSLLEIELETGRMHQIRLQSSVRGHAILGDEKYGSLLRFGPSAEDPRLRPIALHARTLEFADPTTKQPVSITAPLWNAWHDLGINIE